MDSVSYIISRKWITWLVVLICSIIIFFGYTYHIREREMAREERSIELSAVSVLKVAQLTQWYKERASEARFFTTSPPYSLYAQQIVNGDPEADKSYRNALLLIMTDGRYENIFMINKNGEMLFSVVQGYQFTETESKLVANKVFQSGNIMFTEFYFCPPHYKIHIDIVAPIFDLYGDIFAALVLRTDPAEYLYPLIAEWPTPRESAETYLVRRERDSLIYLSNLKFLSNSALNLKLSLKRTDISIIKAISDSNFNKESHIIKEGMDYRGKRVISDVREVPGTNWSIVSEIDTDEVFKEVNKRSVLLSIIILLLLSSSGFSIAWLYHFRQRNIYRELLHKSSELHESQEEFMAILYSIGDGVITTDYRGEIKEMNHVAEKLTGWKESESRGRLLDEVFVVSDEISNDSLKFSYNSLLISKTGDEIPVSHSRAPIKNPEGEITGSVIVFQDRTEEQQRENMIVKRLYLLEYSVNNTLLDTIITGLNIIKSMTKSSMILYHSTKADLHPELIIAWSSQAPEETKIDTSSLAEAIIDSDLVKKAVSTKSYLTYDFVSSEKMSFNASPDLTITRLLVVPVVRNGEVKATICSINKSFGYTDKDVNVIYYFDEIIKGISERKVAENELINLKNELEIKVREKTSDLLVERENLKEINRELESFSYSVSHDLRAPLRAIDGFTRILMEEHSKNLNEDGERVCKIIIENTQRMGQLIDDLLAFSRLSRTELKFTTIDTTDMVRKIFLDLTNEEMRERISFNVSPLCNSKGDITMIRQIWVNLISNSLKFSSSRERAVIDIECTKSGEMNEYFIRDNGVGFDMKYKDKLFGVFQRLHSSRDFEGTGVGLAIVQRVVHRHGGSVNAKGEVDKGAQFSFSLPAK
jgi:PAS domain S-box-containing protein